MNGLSMDISVIVVSYNTAALLPEMLEKLHASFGHYSVEVIFVDNNSSDDSVEVIRRISPHSKLIVNAHNVGFGRANNQALAHARGRYLLLLNTDAFVAPNSLAVSGDYMDRNAACGILGVRLVGRDGVLQPCARFFPTALNLFLQRSGLVRLMHGVQMVDDMSWDHASIKPCDWVVGCYLMVRREVVDRIGLFDPRYFLYYEEVDMCLAAKRAGWQVIFNPHTTVVHIGGESAKSQGNITKSGRQLSALQVESELLYFRKNFSLAYFLLYLLASWVADAGQFFTRILKRKPFAEVVETWQHAKLLSQLLFKTRFATQPTR